ncbi:MULTISPECIES: hypothetical protein [Mammaliicoccus]|uniref:Uncharacterized protein n=1 Tax=Mammaliicoccus fleurettii TaxID=150056 RepID=A0ABS5MPC1_9STAP|nr:MULTISPECIES: hypothetical protein [Mammaliicoccus]HCN60337.1 hypothetical protein [Staphylococcus sp.]MBL0848008.1 hypothetical protein [Mammaliicoccus fleurettii]MBS3672766.1 hypothetical protein [Mammaliicoccus fleurettii]MBS3697773.1 hypothetical protein [Mammaliicoccus fleurettii]MEB6200850.1 hypothetical protein [Mammaliicoccus fleurettii]
MFKLFFIFLVVFVVYYLFLKLYIMISKFLKKQEGIKNNYIVNNVLLSSKKEIDFFDFIIIFVITYIVIYR